MNDLQANIVFQRLRNARRDREAAAEHGTGPHADFHAARAAFWMNAAHLSAAGDLTPVRFPEDPPATPQGDPVRVILVVIQ